MMEVAIKIIGAFEIAKLRLEPDDILVVKVDRPLSKETTDRIRKHLTGLLPQGIKTMIIERGVDLAVLTKSEIDGRTE
jgi:superfamily I DNA and RNA helicase